MLPPRPKQVPRRWIASLGQSTCRPCVVNNIRTAAATVGRGRGVVGVGRYVTTQTSLTSAGSRPSSVLLAVPARPVIDITPCCPRLFQLQIRGKKTRTVVQLNDLPLPPVVESAVNGPLLVVEESVQEEGTSTARRKRIKRTILQLDQLPVSQTTTLTSDPILDAQRDTEPNEDIDSGKSKRGRRRIVKLDDSSTTPVAMLDEALLPVKEATEEAAEVEQNEPSTQRKRDKTRTVRLKEIPQGALLPDESFPPPQQEDQEPAYPAVIQQHRHNMQKFDNCVLLTRVGSFYEMYFEHAEEVGPLLNLKVSQKKTSGGPVSMAGFPFFQLDRYLKVLVEDLNRHVAIAEEYRNSPSEQIKSGGLMHNRRVTRIVTPGTLIDENFMDPYANNYIMAIHMPSSSLEGSSSFQEALNSETGQRKESLVGENIQTLKDWAPMLDAKIPTETVIRFTDDEIKAGNVLLHYVTDRLQGLSMKLQPPIRHDNMQIMTIDKNSMRSLEIKKTMREGFFTGSLLHAIRRTVTKSGARLLNEWLSAPSTSLSVINSRLDLITRFISNPDLSDAITVLLHRSHDTQRLVQKFALNRGDADDLLRLASTIKATEDIVNHLKSTISSEDNNPEEDDCLTRLIDRISLEQPLKLAKRIWDAIDEEGLVQQHQLEDSETGEMLALAQEIVKGVGTEEDGRALLPKGATAKSNRARAELTQNRNQQEKDLSKDNRKMSLRNYYGEDNQVWIMKPKANRALAKLHAELRSLQEQKEKLTEEFRAKYAAPSLTLNWKAGLGHVCVVRGRDARLAMGETSRRTRTSSSSNSMSDPISDTTDADAADADGEPIPEPVPEPESLSTLRTLSTTRTTRTFHHPLWTSLGESLDHVRLRIRSEETALFSSLRSNVVTLLIKLRRNALVLDELDIATSLARLATEQNLVRPILHDSSTTNGSQGMGTRTVIVGGRHPTVEPSLLSRGMTFQKNDCLIGSPGQGAIWLITGPNMAGKSTFLRQNALITILAQMGCYVPADYAELGIVDAIFSRVGSADNLYADQSTFMVEMMETAAILRQATPRSFVIMDEIGRGTTPEDGTAVAFASLHHLLTVNKCRGLFATHFHAVEDMLKEQGLVVDGASSAGASWGVAMYCTDVEEDESGGFVYVHKLRKGMNRQSHALKVARLAGLPEPAIKMAQQVLAVQGVVA
ncbi:hypothetical protein NEUTE2DRAFT_99616 [Neurospora tetrasperma FGSC 2509]|nr:hypothetical protein NEUTE2DRAFT_99616 [Neurospora tetrasperma FGSC 2509]